MLPRVSSADALLATGRALRDGCVNDSRSLTNTVHESLFVRNRSFGFVQSPRAVRGGREDVASGSYLLTLSLTEPSTNRPGAGGDQGQRDGTEHRVGISRDQFIGCSRAPSCKSWHSGAITSLHLHRLHGHRGAAPCEAPRLFRTVPRGGPYPPYACLGCGTIRMYGRGAFQPSG
jgi:hypothetical protein